MDELPEEIAYNRIRVWRDKALSPLIRILTFLHIGPNMVSYAGMFFMIVFVVTIQFDSMLAFFCLVLSQLLDAIDGGLARHQNISSKNGMITDFIIDNVNYTLFIVGLTSISLLSGPLAVLFIYCFALDKSLLLATDYSTNKTHFMTQAKIGFIPNIFTGCTYLLFLLFVFWKIQFFDIPVLIFTCIIIGQSIQQFRKLVRCTGKYSG